LFWEGIEPAYRQAGGQERRQVSSRSSVGEKRWRASTKASWRSFWRCPGQRSPSGSEDEAEFLPPLQKRKNPLERYYLKRVLV